MYCRIRHSVRISTTQSKLKKVAASVLGWDYQDEEEVLLDQNALVEEFGTELLSVIVVLVHYMVSLFVTRLHSAYL